MKGTHQGTHGGYPSRVPTTPPTKGTHQGKSPAFQFYPGDWRRDLPLRCCTLRSRGLWIEMMNLMHEGAPYGYLATEQGPITDAVVLARLVNAPVGETRASLKELEKAKVFSRTPKGVIYSRRMVRDQALRERRAAGGSKSIGHPKTLPPKDPSRVPMEGTHQGYPEGYDAGTPPASASASAFIKTPPDPHPMNGFDQFKAVYPKRAKWPDAEKAWRQVGASAHVVAILADVARRRVSADWQDQGGRFIPLPASYLRGRRWEDELLDANGAGGSTEEDPYAGQPHLWDCACGEVHEGVRGEPRPECPNRPSARGQS